MLYEHDRLLFVTGFGAITFLLSCLVFIVVPMVWPRWLKTSEWETGPPVVLSLLLLAITSTAFAFYIRFVGRVPVTLYIMFKIILVCLLPNIILIILYKNKSMERAIAILQAQANEYLNDLAEKEMAGPENDTELIGENKLDKITVKVKDIVYVKSADNYVEVVYLLKGSLERKLIRSTLKNIETQLAVYHGIFVRCHRTAIVNISFADKLYHTYSGYHLKITITDENLPVSRQFLVQVRLAIAKGE
ncbi:MAG: LytTR family transcriptional regulator [Bacteroidales bacterium]|nr:LytTR family transcriptional regulator [Bacteroidales bacterium]